MGDVFRIHATEKQTVEVLNPMVAPARGSGCLWDSATATAAHQAAIRAKIAPATCE